MTVFDCSVLVLFLLCQFATALTTQIARAESGTSISGALGVSNFGAAQLEGMRSLVPIGPESADMSNS